MPGVHCTWGTGMYTEAALLREASRPLSAQGALQMQQAHGADAAGPHAQTVARPHERGVRTP
eukprot:14298748-Alexandrium_andersonii.AAC.1